MAINRPYRRRARRLCVDAPAVPWVVLTDEPDDFTDLGIRAVRHEPTGPMAADYVALSLRTEGGTAAYHDKRFALLAALEEFDTAIFVDADSRMRSCPSMVEFPPGIAVLAPESTSIFDHLSIWGSWRLPYFRELARHLMGSEAVLHTTRWCPETIIAITKDGREDRFFEGWAIGANFLQGRGVYSGEGGVISLAASYAGWAVNYEVMPRIGPDIKHEGGGPKVQ